MKHTNGAGAYLQTKAPGTDTDVCPVCRGSGWIGKRVAVEHPDFGQAFPCRCQGAGDPETRVAALRRYSNLGPLSRITFDSTRSDGVLPDAGNRQLFQEGLAAAVEYAESPAGWLTFAGPSGCGKTHLAVAIANRCIERGDTVFFIVTADLLDHLRSTYSPDATISYDELFNQVRDVPILVLDDLGVHGATSWATEKLFQVLNHRFNAALPTVITVRGPLHRLEDGLCSRIESAEGFSRVLPLGRYNSRLAGRIGEIPELMRARMTFFRFYNYGGDGASEADQESLAKAKQAAETFAAGKQHTEQSSFWLMFTGPRGSGKTHLAVAIGNEYLRRGQPVFFAFVPSLLDHLRSTFSPNSPIGYDELFEQLKTVPLLILDDLGAESSTPWAEDKLYQIIVHRHEAMLPTVITSVILTEELEEARPRIASRLLDAAVDKHVITAPNYRQAQRPHPIKEGT